MENSDSQEPVTPHSHEALLVTDGTPVQGKPQMEPAAPKLHPDSSLPEPQSTVYKTEGSSQQDGPDTTKVDKHPAKCESSTHVARESVERESIYQWLFGMEFSRENVVYKYVVTILAIIVIPLSFISDVRTVCAPYAVLLCQISLAVAFLSLIISFLKVRRRHLFISITAVSMIMFFSFSLVFVLERKAGTDAQTVAKTQKDYHDAEINETVETREIVLKAIRGLNLQHAPVQVGPMIQHEVQDAIGEIAQCAAEKDIVCHKALDLLIKGKPQEAAEALYARGEAKLAERSSASKEAVASLRTAGTLELLSNPVKARQAFDQALATNPNDVESLLGAAMIDFLAGNFPSARGKFERASSAIPLTVSDRFDRYYALWGLGVIGLLEGVPIEKSIEKMSSDLDELQMISVKDKADEEMRNGLISAYNISVCQMYSVSYQYTKALRNCQISVGITKDVMKRYPTLDFLGGNTAGIEAQTADIFIKLGDYTKARELYLDAASLIEPLVIKGGDNSLLLENLARVRDGQAAIYAHEKKPPGVVLDKYQESIALRGKVVARDRNVLTLSALSGSYQREAEYLLKNDMVKESVKPFENFLSLNNEVLRTDANNPVFQHDFAIANAKLGFAFYASGDFSKAVEYISYGIDHLRQLKQNSMQVAYELAPMFERKGRALLTLGRYQDAADEFNNEIKALNASGEPQLSGTDRLLRLAGAYDRLGISYADQRSQSATTAAIDSFSHSLEIRETAYATTKVEPSSMWEIAISQSNLAAAYYASPITCEDNL